MKTRIIRRCEDCPSLRWRRAFQRRGPSKPMVVTAVDREAGVITVDAAE